MKINKVLKKLSVTFLCFVILILLKNSNSQAVLQSNGNDGAAYNLSDWMLNVRKMEELGGAMGLSESLNENLTTNGDSNNIDVHMQKNTEYGALAILSASAYGNPNKVNDGETTTGNITGAVMNFNNEWTAATMEGAIDNFSARYRNYYQPTYVAKKGDVIKETEGWHGSGYQWYFSNYQPRFGIVRGFGNGIFGYGVLYENVTFGNRFSDISCGYHARAVIVQGEGL